MCQSSGPRTMGSHVNALQGAKSGWQSRYPFPTHPSSSCSLSYSTCLSALNPRCPSVFVLVLVLVRISRSSKRTASRIRETRRGRETARRHYGYCGFSLLTPVSLAGFQGMRGTVSKSQNMLHVERGWVGYSTLCPIWYELWLIMKKSRLMSPRGVVDMIQIGNHVCLLNPRPQQHHLAFQPVRISNCYEFHNVVSSRERDKSP